MIMIHQSHFLIQEYRQSIFCPPFEWETSKDLNMNLVLLYDGLEMQILFWSGLGVKAMRKPDSGNIHATEWE